MVSAYTLRSCTTRDSNSRPNVVMSLNIPSGVMPRAAAPIDGSVKWCICRPPVLPEGLEKECHNPSVDAAGKAVCTKSKFSKAGYTKILCYEGTGEWFDLSKKPIERASFTFGGAEKKTEGYFSTS